MGERFFLTTAIDYVNGPPHLGHAYEKVLADAVARWHRSLGEDVHFLTGVDQHGQKMLQTAEKLGTSPAELSAEMTPKFVELWRRLGIAYDAFAETTNADHQRQVREKLQQLYDAGEIYHDEYLGYYSTRQEQFVTEKDKVDGEWPELLGEVVEMREPNYLFKLAKHQDWLREHIRANPDFIFPAFRANEVLAALERPLGDLCISRPTSRLPWGIPLPFDEDYVTYVWFDALLNYYTFDQKDGERRWPADEHHIGKDILVPAHAVYWPIMLHALGLPLPKRLVVHGFWSINGAKMSKSTGNFIEPHEMIDRFGADALRFFLLRECATGQDADFTEDKLRARYTSDLGNDFGNLAQRTLSMINRYRDGVVPAYAEADLTEAEAALRSDAVLDQVSAAMGEYQTKAALEAIWALATRANQYVDETAPWKLAKDEAQAKRLDVVLAHLAETVRRLAVLVAPYLPAANAGLAAQLQLAAPQTRLDEAKFGSSLAGHTIAKPTPLFPRLEDTPKA